MNLQKKHLAAYYPYKVQCTAGGFVGVLDTINSRTTKIRVSCSDYWESSHKYKMILRPMKDIYTFEFKPKYGQNKVTFSDIMPIEYLATLECGQWIEIPFEWIEKLFKYHFDLFGLIKAGLAVDKNSL